MVSKEHDKKNFIECRVLDRNDTFLGLIYVKMLPEAGEYLQFDFAPEVKVEKIAHIVGMDHGYKGFLPYHYISIYVDYGY